MKDNFSYDEAVEEIARRYGIPKSVYSRMVNQESGGNDSAVSPKGARSRWQIMPATAKGLGINPADPLEAAEGGLRILRDNYKRFRKHAENEKHAWMMAVAGYHTNPNNVEKDIKAGGYGLPLTSDGLITTRDHVLKIFDGLPGEALDRSPLGTIQKAGRDRKDFSPAPDDLPQVSISSKPLDDVYPTADGKPPKLSRLSLFNQPPDSLKDIAGQLPAPPPIETQETKSAAAVLPNPVVNVPQQPAPKLNDVQTPPAQSNPPAVAAAGQPQNTVQPQIDEAEYQSFLKYTKRADSPETRQEFENLLKSDFGKSVEVVSAKVESPQLETPKTERGQIQNEPEFILNSQEAPTKFGEANERNLKNINEGYRYYSKRYAEKPTYEQMIEDSARALYGNDIWEVDRAFTQATGGKLLSPTHHRAEWEADIDENYKDGVYPNIGGNYNPYIARIAEAYRTGGVEAMRAEAAKNTEYINARQKGIESNLDHQQAFESQEREKQDPDYLLRKQAEDNIYNSVFAHHTKEEVEKEIERLRKAQIDPETVRRLEAFGTISKSSLGNYFGGNSNITSGVVGAAGGLADIVAAVNRPLAWLGITGDDAYIAWQKIGKGARIIENSMKGEGVISDIQNLAGRAVVDIPKYVALSALPGGAIAAFGVDAGLQSAGRGESLDNVATETVKGLVLGGIFHGAGKLSEIAEKGTLNALLPKGASPAADVELFSKLVGTTTRIGTIGAGSFAVEKTAGAETDEAFKSAIMMTLFDVVMQGRRFGEISDLSGKVFRMSRKGKTVDVTVEPNGEVKLLKGNVPPEYVEAEFNTDKVIDVELGRDGVYRAKGDNSPIRATEKTETQQTSQGAAFEQSPVRRESFTSETQPPITNPAKPEIVKTVPAEIKESKSVSAEANLTGKTVVTGKGIKGEVLEDDGHKLTIETEDGSIIMPLKRKVEVVENGAEIKQPSNKETQAAPDIQPKPEQNSDLLSNKKAEAPIKQTDQTGFAIGDKVGLATGDGGVFYRGRIVGQSIERGGRYRGEKLYEVEIENTGETNKYYERELARYEEPQPEINSDSAPKYTVAGPESLNRRTSDFDADEKVLSNKLTDDLINAIEKDFDVSSLAKANISPDGKMNEQAFRIMAEAHKLAFEQDSHVLFFGAYLNPAKTQKVRAALTKVLGLENITDSDLGKLPPEKRLAKRLLNQFDNSVDKKFGDAVQIVTSKNAPNGLRLAHQEENAHRSDFRIGLSHAVGKAIVKNSPAGRRAMMNLNRGAYRGSSENILAIETVGKLFVDNNTELGISEEQKESLRQDYLEGLLASGAAFETIKKEFENISKTGKESIENAKRRQAERELQRSGRNNEPYESSREKTVSIYGDGAKGTRARSGEIGLSNPDRQSRNAGRGILEDFGSGNERINHLDQLAPAQKRYVERHSENDSDLANRLSEEILYSKPKKSDKMSFGDYVVDLWNIPKALKATLDLSAGGRQGLITSIAHPVFAAKAFGRQLKAFGSEKYHKEFKESLENHPLAKLAEDSGLYISSRGDGSISQREEQFMARILADDPFFNNPAAEKSRRVVTLPVRSSERTYTTYLDSLRMDTFTRLAEQVYNYDRRNNITDSETHKKQMEGIAKFINYATGRGSLGKFEDSANLLNMGVFSARNWASRFQVMNPAFYAKLPPGARAAAMKDFGKYLGAMVLIYGLWKLAGGDIVLDPNNPDFLKIRIGQYSYDVSGSMVQQIRYLSQMVTSIASGDFQEAGKDTLRYGQSKLAPVPSAIINTAKGENFIGEPTNAKKEALGLITPISAEQLTDGARSDGWLGILQAAPDIFGFSTTRYDNSLEVGMKLADAERRLAKAKTPEEIKDLQSEVGKLRKLYYRAQKSKGELPAEFSRTPEEEEKLQKYLEKDENVTFDTEEDAPEKEKKSPKSLTEMVEFHKTDSGKLFNFAKDELESLIIQKAENMRIRGQLTPELVKFVKSIIPDYEPLRELQPGVNLRPEKLKKPPQVNKDYPKPPRLPRPPK